MNLDELKSRLAQQVDALADEVRQKHIELGVSMGRLQEANEVLQALSQRAEDGNNGGGDEPPLLTIAQLLENADDPKPTQTE